MNANNSNNNKYFYNNYNLNNHHFNCNNKCPSVINNILTVEKFLSNFSNICKGFKVYKILK